MAHSYLITLYLALSAAHLCGTENSVCDDGWIYHPNSNSCLQIVRRSVYLYYGIRQCTENYGGQYRNISGTLAEVTDNNKYFIQEYLRFLNIPRAIAGMNTSVFSRSGIDVIVRPPIYFFTKSPDVVPMLLSTDYGNDVGWEILFNSYSGPIVCQVKAGIPEPERASCPAKVKVASLSDNNVTLYLEPGDISSKMKLLLKTTEKCPSTTSGCQFFQHGIAHSAFLHKPMNYTVVGLMANRNYLIQFEVLDKSGQFVLCNETMDIRTEVYVTEETILPVKEEQFNALVIGFSFGLTISVIIIAVLTVLYCRLLRKPQEGYINSSVIASVMDKNTVKDIRGTDNQSSSLSQITRFDKSAIGSDMMQKMKQNTVGNYGNVEATPHDYDQTNKVLDEHIYES